jgi:ABC-type phosphate transport system substrate-binding protein
MKISLPNLVVFALVAVVVAGIAGCGGNSETPADATGNVANAPTTNAATSNTAGSTGG